MATAAIKRILSGVLVMGLVTGNVVPIEPAYAQREAADKMVAVSYTHLTLPTSDLV